MVPVLTATLRFVPVMLVCGLLWHSAAAAQARSPDDDYEQAVQLGLEEFRVGNYPEARSRFLEALERDENARVLRALGKVEYELHHYRASAAYLERALDSEARPLTAEMRTDCERILTQARGYIGRYRLMTKPANVSIRVDGHEAELEHGVLVLEVGDRAVEVDAVGYRPWRQSLTVRGGSEQVLSIQLIAETPEVEEDARATAEPRDQAPPASQPLRKKWWFWTTLGVVVAGGVVAGVLLSMREPEVKEASGGSTKMTIPVNTRAAQ
jgi:hypothetical protein